MNVHSSNPAPTPAPSGEVLARIGAAPGGKLRRQAFRAAIWLGAAAVVVLGVRQCAAARAGAGGPRYETAVVARGDLRVIVTATGTLQAKDTVEVGAEVSGRLLRVTVDHNDVVKKGDVLAEIDAEQMRAAVEENLAQVAQAAAAVAQGLVNQDEARRNLARAEAQAKDGLVSARELETAQAAARRADANLASARASQAFAAAALRAAQAKLAKAVIVSPMDGVVLARYVEPGQTVTAGFQTPILFKLAADLRRMELRADVDEADVGRVAEGQAATFTVDAFADRDFPSSVLSLRNEPKTTQGVVSYEAVLAVDNADGALRPGMTATATIVVDHRGDALLVPNAALRFAPPAPPTGMVGVPVAKTAPLANRVHVLRDGRLAVVAVKPGASDGLVTEILDGELAAGAVVVTDISGGM